MGITPLPQGPFGLKHGCQRGSLRDHLSLIFLESGKSGKIQRKEALKSLCLWPGPSFCGIGFSTYQLGAYLPHIPRPMQLAGNARQQALGSVPTWEAFPSARELGGCEYGHKEMGTCNAAQCTSSALSCPAASLLSHFGSSSSHGERCTRSSLPALIT